MRCFRSCAGRLIARAYSHSVTSGAQIALCDLMFAMDGVEGR